ncbi:hypothetical protein C8A03DRAFT_39240, partial [Achaetomium macrosporum]
MVWDPEGPSLVGEAQPPHGNPLRAAEADTPDYSLGLDLVIHGQGSLEDLSSYLFGRGQSVGASLNFIDHVLKGYVDGLASGLSRPAFIHFRDWKDSRRRLALVEEAAVSQLYAVRTPQSDPVLVRAIEARLLQIQAK